MKKRKISSKLITLVDDHIKISNRHGNGILRLFVKGNKAGTVFRYSLAYINPHLFNGDNGRVLGYDNSHGRHHRHFMGKEEPVEFESYETILERFETEWRSLHEKAKEK